MQPISSYADEADKLRLILQGSSGAGKTTIAAQFPGAYIIDIDVNLGGTLRFLQEKKLPLPIGFDVLDRNENVLKDGKPTPVPMPDRYQRLVKLLVEAEANPLVQTVVIDSATGLSEILIAEVLRIQQKSTMSKQEWGYFGNCGRQFLGTLSMMRKHIVLIAHEKLKENETGQVNYPIKVAWPGQVGQNIGIWFTNVWRAQVKIQPSGLTNSYKWEIETLPSQKYELKNSLGLPSTFEFKWDIIQAALDKGKTK